MFLYKWAFTYFKCMHLHTVNVSNHSTYVTTNIIKHRNYLPVLKIRYEIFIHLKRTKTSWKFKNSMQHHHLPALIIKKNHCMNSSSYLDVLNQNLGKLYWKSNWIWKFRYIQSSVIHCTTTTVLVLVRNCVHQYYKQTYPDKSLSFAEGRILHKVL